jgi:predicted dehydrogenase
MALYLSPEQREKGEAAFQEAVGQNLLTRREFMKAGLAAGAVVPVTAAAYFGYKALEGNPVKVGLIGAGDEGGVLVGNHNPDFLEFVAVADLRPSNQKRIFTGEAPPSPRKGLKHFYGHRAEKGIKVYSDYKELLANPDIEAVVIALPLHLHAPVAIEAMQKGKHVLCEKLMAWNVKRCKDMIKAAQDNNCILTIGHQRHYSLLYAHAVEVLGAGTLGDVKHIRALWHRNNAWPMLDKEGNPVTENGQPVYRDSWRPRIPDEDRKELEANIRKHGYKSMEELVRWRLYDRTGGGLMAELGSHQLDACSIFLGKVHPLAVSGLGGKIFYHDDREVDDHVFVTFEFPGKYYFERKDNGEVARDGAGKPRVKDKNDIVVVTYSSINTNSFEPYGECVMGVKGTLIVEKEEKVMLLPERDPNPKRPGKATEATVTSAGGGRPAEVSSGTSGPAIDPAKAREQGEAALAGPVSRGYTEEMEHFAYCVRMFQKAQKARDKDEQERLRLAPRCHGRVAMADAIIALTSNQAMKHGRRIAFEEAWFDPARMDALPDRDMEEKIITG